MLNVIIHSCLYCPSCPSYTRPSENFCRRHHGELFWKSVKSRVNRRGARTVPCGTPTPLTTVQTAHGPIGRTVFCLWGRQWSGSRWRRRPPSPAASPAAALVGWSQRKGFSQPPSDDFTCGRRWVSPACSSRGMWGPDGVVELTSLVRGPGTTSSQHRELRVLLFFNAKMH